MKTPLVFHNHRGSTARVAKCSSAPLPLFPFLFFFFSWEELSRSKKSTFCRVTRADISAPPGRCAAQKIHACAKTRLHTCCPGGVFGRWARDDPPTVKCVNQVCLSRVTHSLEEFDGFLVSSSVVANSSQNQVKAGCKKLRQWRNQMCFVFSIFFAKWRWCGVWMVRCDYAFKIRYWLILIIDTQIDERLEIYRWSFVSIEFLLNETRFIFR